VITIAILFLNSEFDSLFILNDFFGFHGIASYVQVAQAFGGWDKASKEHFADGAIYDQISQSIKRRFSFQ
jgi:hypothetical protein